MNPWTSHSSERRDRLRIVAEILEITRRGALKTQVMYQSRLSFTQVNDYLEFMLETNLMKKIKQDDRNIYKTTPNGLDFVQRYRDLAELLRTEEEDNESNSKITPLHQLRNVKSVVYVSKNF